MTVATVDFRGWKHNLKISNGETELIVTLDVGPRVISYRRLDGKNVFKEYDDQMGVAGEPEWKIRGGHRLWVGPEDESRTYAPDNAPVAYQDLGGGTVRFTPPAETKYGIQKEFDLRLAPTGSGVRMTHRVKNIGSTPTALAVWSISVMAPGGVEIIPLPSKRPHPGDAKNARSAADFAPNQLMTIWPFFHFDDPRWRFGSKFITLRQSKDLDATKIGLAHREGAVGYLNGDTLFVKRFDYEEGKVYPDFGVNFETFTNPDMLEIETLGPITTLAPGEIVEHIESWELFSKIGVHADQDALEKSVGPHLRKTQ